MNEDLSNSGLSHRGRVAALAVFFAYVAVLALAAVSELFDFGWFNHPIFK
ncbi:MAG: hypothetical protein JXQ83_08155 [Candidatus Glassbacteria bacterium]|nr:hypothetical protein [Candidatus Glassbacteria bacterium]